MEISKDLVGLFMVIKLKKYKSKGEQMEHHLEQSIINEGCRDSLIGRRNLFLYQRAEVALKLEPLIREKARERQVEGGKEKVIQKSVNPVHTNKELGEIAGVSYDTIARVRVIQKKAPEDVKQKIIDGGLSIHEAYTNLRQEKAL